MKYAKTDSVYLDRVKRNNIVGGRLKSMTYCAERNTLAGEKENRTAAIKEILSFLSTTSPNLNQSDEKIVWEFSNLYNSKAERT
jgi:hypothetical protein